MQEYLGAEKKTKEHHVDELTEEEMRERIECPYCKQFPFGSEEIQVYDVVRIVCFKTDHPTEKVGVE